jgi:hypothetical protein
MRNANHPGEGRGTGGQRCHQPRGAMAIDSNATIGHNDGLRATADAASSHQALSVVDPSTPLCPRGMQNGREAPLTSREGPSATVPEPGPQATSHLRPLVAPARAS